MPVNRRRDTIRGRIEHPERFDKIKQYAQKRWDRSRNLRHSRRWLGVIESIDQRKPLRRSIPEQYPAADECYLPNDLI